MRNYFPEFSLQPLKSFLVLQSVFLYFDFQTVVCTSVVSSFAGCHTSSLFVFQWSQTCLHFSHCPQSTDTLLSAVFHRQKIEHHRQLVGNCGSWEAARKKNEESLQKKHRSSSVQRKVPLLNMILLSYKTNRLIRIILSQNYALSQQDFFLMDLLENSITFVQL